MNLSSVIRYALVTGALLCASSASWAAGHEQCQSCHASIPASASNLIQPLSGLCISCHQRRVDAGEHAVDIPVTSVSASLPLRAGKMTCVTCHDPHGQGLSLRLADPQLCESCH